jgi:hypothetical protein
VDQSNPGWEGVFIGTMIVGLGLILLVDPSRSIWPFLIISLGFARFMASRPDGSRDGGWLMFIGVWLLPNEMRVLRLRDSWPLILVALGLHTMWKALVRPNRASRTKAEQS